MFVRFLFVSWLVLLQAKKEQSLHYEHNSPDKSQWNERTPFASVFVRKTKSNIVELLNNDNVFGTNKHTTLRQWHRVSSQYVVAIELDSWLREWKKGSQRKTNILLCYKLLRGVSSESTKRRASQSVHTRKSQPYPHSLRQLPGR